MSTIDTAAAAPLVRGDATPRTRVRFGIIAMLFMVTAFNYADRATLSIAGTASSTDLGLDAVTMGYVFSAFGWSYMIGQLLGG